MIATICPGAGQGTGMPPSLDLTCELCSQPRTAVTNATDWAAYLSVLEARNPRSSAGRAVTDGGRLFPSSLVALGCAHSPLERPQLAGCRAWWPWRGAGVGGLAVRPSGRRGGAGLLEKVISEQSGAGEGMVTGLPGGRWPLRRGTLKPVEEAGGCEQRGGQVPGYLLICLLPRMA